MNRGTTPTHTFSLPFSTSLIKTVKVIYSQDDVVILCKRINDCSFDGNKIATTLTQEETFAFDCKKNVDIQLRVLTNAGDSLASNIVTVDVGKCLDDEVLE